MAFKKVFRRKPLRVRKAFRRRRAPRMMVRRKATYKSPFPNMKKVKLRYQDVIELTSNTSGIAQLTYNLNSMYDPYSAAGGHQPRYYDTLLGADNAAAPYSGYRVVGCKVKAVFVNDNSGTTTAGVFFMHARHSTDAQLTAAYIDTGETPNTICRDVNTGNAPAGTCSLSKYFGMQKLMGVKDVKDHDGAYASYNTNPNELWQLDIGYQPYGAAVTTSVFVRLKLVYYAILSDLNFVGTS